MVLGIQRFFAQHFDEGMVRGYLRVLERICQTKVLMNLSLLLKSLGVWGTAQRITQKQ